MRRSVKTAIIAPILIALVAGITAMAGVVSVLSSNTVSSLTAEVIDTSVGLYSREFGSMCEDAYGTVSSVAPLVADAIAADETREITDPRGYVVQMLSDVLSASESVMGIWTAWEPNAFDGQDSLYAGNGYHDASGRFVPYLARDGSGISITPLVDYDDPVAGEYYQGARTTGRPYMTDPYPYEVNGAETLMCSIGIPIVRDGRTAGVVGVDLDLSGFIETMNQSHILGDGFLVVLSPGGLVATHPDPVYIMQPYTNIGWMRQYEAQFETVFQNGGELSGQAYSDIINSDMDFQMQSLSIGATCRNWIVCGVIPAATVTAASQTLLWVIVAIGVALFVVVGVITYVITGRSLAPLTPLNSFLEQASATGNIFLSPQDERNIATFVRRKDELGQTIVAVDAFLKRIIEVSKALETVAGGDLTGELEPLSDVDTLGLSLQKMEANLNDMFAQIGSSSVQVSAGSGQIADGAQALAAGSTEQSASVQELSSAIAEIAGKIAANTELAEHSARLAGDIKDNAEKGSRQMEEMMASVKEISQSSQDIGKVIKVIDDIAFQTNILALNAAVEAARAGQHGKGFAVVAEEVRNLAAKSAEAAKDTESLIANSMQKAEQGVHIADETASSLAEIVSGISESNEIAGKIAASSEEQSAGIAQINNGIDQVAQVVQQNSATAEESAAASEQLSGQAAVLKGLVEQFRLKG